jgi:hypothetical protein
MDFSEEERRLLFVQKLELKVRKDLISRSVKSLEVWADKKCFVFNFSISSHFS